MILRAPHAIASSLARDRGCTLSTAVVDMLRQSLGANTQVEVIDRLTGFPLLASGRPITTDDVRRLDDDE